MRSERLPVSRTPSSLVLAYLVVRMVRVLLHLPEEVLQVGGFVFPLQVLESRPGYQSL